MLKLNYLKSIVLLSITILTFFSCEKNKEEEGLDKSAVACSDIKFDILFSSNGEKIISLNYSEKSSAYIPIIEDAVSYEWTVNGESVENKFITPDTFKDLPSEITDAIPNHLKNLAYVEFDRFKDAEVSVTVKTKECTEGITVTKSFTKTPPFNSCDPISYHVDLTKDFKNLILNVNDVLGTIQTTWTVNSLNDSGSVVGTTTSNEVRNYTTALNEGLVEICVDVTTSHHCTGGVTICKKIVFSKENLEEIKKDYEEHYKTNPIEHVSLRLVKNDDETYTPTYSFK